MESDPVSYANQLSLRVHGIASLSEHEIVRRLRGLFLILVDPDDMPDDKSHRRFLNATATAASSLEAVGEVGIHFYRFPILVELVCSNMYRLLPWVQYFYRTKIRNRLDPIHSNEDDKQTLIRNLSTVLHAILLKSALVGGVHLQLAANYDIISGLWLEEDVQHPIHTRNEHDGALVSEILRGLFRTTKSTGSVIEALVHSADGDAERVARVARNKLRLAMKSHSKGLPIRPHHYIAFMLFIHDDNAFKDNLRASFHQHEMHTSFAKAMRLMSDQVSADTKIEGPGFGASCDIYFGNFNIRMVKEAGDGTRVLRQCIRYGALDGLVQLLKLHDTKADRHIGMPVLKNVFDLLYFGLGVRSVCVDIQDAFKRLAPLKEMPLSPGRKEWKQFTDAVLLQSVILHIMNRHTADIMEPMGLCSHCKGKFIKSSLKKCGRCRITLYCSKACQVVGWKSGHKNTCYSLEQTGHLPEFEDVKDLEDRVFATLMAQLDFRRHQIHLRKLVRSRYPDVDPDLVGFTINLARGLPPLYSPFLIHELSDDDDGTRRTKNIVIAAAENRGTTGKHTIMIRVISPTILMKVDKIIVLTETFEEGTDIECPRTLPEMALTDTVRPSGLFVDGNTQVPLEACHDMMDDLLQLMAIDLEINPALIRDPKKLVDRVMRDFEAIARTVYKKKDRENKVGNVLTIGL